jgi:hypothetical protein
MKRLHRRVLSWMLDIILLLPALVLVLVENVLWAGSRALLRRIKGLPFLCAAQRQLAKLPAYAALPLFLVPEACSHVAGFAAAFLLTQRHFLAATLLAVLGKGLATLILVWIYQACEPVLLRVRWFARMHDAVMTLRRWVFTQLQPLRDRVLVRLRRSAEASGRIARRFTVLRGRLASAVETAWPKH